MSYLFVPASETQYGVVTIGNYIDVIDGNISIPQSVSPNANVTFANLNITGNASSNNASITNNLLSDNVFVFSNLFAMGKLVITSVTPSAGNGIAISNVIGYGYDASFTVTNTGVTYINAGSGITLSGNTGNITISSLGADLINVTGVTANYTATVTDEYIGVFSANAVTITLPASFDGRVYTIKDEYGQGSGKITIQPQVGEFVDGKVSYIISIPNQSVTLVGRAGNWYII
jgi:hypothetical protein